MKCEQCRVRKIKCVFKADGGKCEGCRRSRKDVACSREDAKLPKEGRVERVEAAKDKRFVEEQLRQRQLLRQTRENRQDVLALPVSDRNQPDTAPDRIISPPQTTGMNMSTEAGLYERTDIDIEGPAAYFSEDWGFEDILAFQSSEGFEWSEIVDGSAEFRIPDESRFQALQMGDFV